MGVGAAGVSGRGVRAVGAVLEGLLFFFFFTLVTGPRRSLSLKLSDLAGARLGGGLRLPLPGRQRGRAVDGACKGRGATSS